jgi:hypothetical protein
MRKIITLIVMAWTTGACAAPCDDVLVPALTQAFPAAKFDEEQPARFALPGQIVIHGTVLACRAWPGSPELTLVAVSLDAEADGIESPETGLDIMVVDSSTGKLRARRHETEIFRYGRDPSTFEFVNFDAARYMVSPNRLAFGMRFKRGNMSFGQGFLRLYLRNGNKLDQIAELVSSQAKNFPEYTGSEPRHCEGIMDEVGNASDINRTVAIGSARHHGLADLLVSETRTPHFMALECNDKLRPVKASYTLKYDGRGYHIPEFLR